MTVNDKMALEPGPFLALNLFIFAKYPGKRGKFFRQMDFSLK